jgi:hypothetical protein
MASQLYLVPFSALPTVPGAAPPRGRLLGFVYAGLAIDGLFALWRSLDSTFVAAYPSGLMFLSIAVVSFLSLTIVLTMLIHII